MSGFKRAKHNDRNGLRFLKILKFYSMSISVCFFPNFQRKNQRQSSPRSLLSSKAIEIFSIVSCHTKTIDDVLETSHLVAKVVSNWQAVYVKTFSQFLCLCLVFHTCFIKPTMMETHTTAVFVIPSMLFTRRIHSCTMTNGITNTSKLP